MTDSPVHIARHYRGRHLSALLLAALVCAALAPLGMGRTETALAATGTCSTGVQFTLHPGLPAAAHRSSLPPARDIPRGPFTVSAPLYPGAVQLRTFVASPIPEYPLTPYLQTAAAEYRTGAGIATVKAWYRSAFESCGWQIHGTMSTNASVLTEGITFVSNGNSNLQMEMAFDTTPSGGTYITYGAEQTTLPPRPASSYLRGPFNQVRIAYQINNWQAPKPVHHVVHLVIRDRATIRHLVRAINSLSVDPGGIRSCGGGGNGPAWLTFVRGNGQSIHAWEGDLCVGIRVNGSRSLHDDGRVWNLIARIATARGLVGK